MKRGRNPEQESVVQEPERVAQTHDFPPHKDKAELLHYLQHGEIGRGSTYKEGNIPIVSVNKLRTMLLEAGYTELALASVFFGTHTDLVESKRWPQEDREKLSITFGYDHPYVVDGVRAQTTYDAVELLEYVLPKIGPDMSAQEDELRARVLRELQELEALKEQLNAAGKKQLSLDSWSFTRTGEVIFWLNPWDQQKYSFGWFTLKDLRRWLEDDLESPVFQRNEARKGKLKKAAVKENGVWVTRYKVDLRSAMYKYSRKPYKDLRMLRILLLGCPFPDLAARYAKKVR